MKYSIIIIVFIILNHVLFFTTKKFINFKSLIFNLILCIFYGLSITAGYHRLWTHGSYDTTKFIKYIYMLIASGTCQGSIKDWTSDHKMHHKYEDIKSEYDPYSIKKGFFWAHMGWLFFNKSEEYNKEKQNILNELKKQWNKDDINIIEFQHKHYYKLMILMAYIFPILVAKYLIKDTWKSSISSNFLRILIAWHTTWCINSVAHYIGDKPFVIEHTSRQNHLCSLITMGEGYHNYHHAFPKDYRASQDLKCINFTGWFIRCLYMLGLSINLKYVEKNNQITRKTISQNINYKIIKL
jgi:stearoyl-CoA desaturase (Delta-9 desaturase)